MGVLITSILSSDLSKAIIASDQLALVEGSYVNGKIMHTNSTIPSGELIGYSRIKVEKIFTPSDIPDKLVQILYTYECAAGQECPLTYYDDQNGFEFNYLVFYDNRTSFLIGRMYFTSPSDSVEINLLQGNTVESFTNFNNTVITYKNGTSYTFGDVDPLDPIYSSLYSLMLGFALLNYGLVILEYKWTPFGISPTANVLDDISFYGQYGKVIDKPAVTTTNGDSYDTIHVEYYETSIYGWWDAPECHAYYEASTGLLIKVYESDGVDTWEYLPGDVVLEPPTTATPYAIAGLVIGIALIGLLNIYIRRRK